MSHLEYYELTIDPNNLNIAYNPIHADFKIFFKGKDISKHISKAVYTLCLVDGVMPEGLKNPLIKLKKVKQ